MNQVRIALLLGLVTLSAAPGRAQAASITIFSARMNVAAGELVVTGATFPSSSRAFLLLDPVVELAILSVTPNTLRAKLPATVPKGTFLLAVYDPATQLFGMFDVTGRAATGVDAVADATGRYIGDLDSGSEIIFRRAGELRLRLGITRGGFIPGQGSSALLHLDPACSSPHVLDPPSLAFSFFDTYALTLADGAQPGGPPFGNTLWVPDRAKPRFVPSCDPKPQAYLRNNSGQCVATNQLACGASYRPAKAVDLSHFVPPFDVVP